MAGDWLKFEVSTPDKPEVLSITVDMQWDDPDLTVGKLLRVWRWFDQHTEDGNAHNVTLALLDRIIGAPGFCAAMTKVGWLEVNDTGICLPNFDRHNGKTAKSRALGAKRAANHKSNGKGNAESNAEANAESNAASVTDALPREEKNREEYISPLTPQTGGCSGSLREKKAKAKSERTTLQTFLDRCKAADEPAISAYEPLLRYMRESGLPAEFVNLCWAEFKRDFGPGGKSERKQQALWRRHFQNFVERNFYRLWYAKPAGDGVTYELTTVGMQAQIAQQNRRAA